MQFLFTIFIIHLIRVLVQSWDDHQENQQRTADANRAFKFRVASLSKLLPKGALSARLRKCLVEVEEDCLPQLREKLGKDRFVNLCANRSDEVLLIIQLYLVHHSRPEKLLGAEASYYQQLLKQKGVDDLGELTWAEIVRNIPIFMWLRIGNFDPGFIVHVARGKNVREHPYCADYSKKMAHAFYNAEPGFWVYDCPWAYSFVHALKGENGAPMIFWNLLVSFAMTPAQRKEGQKLERIIRWWVTFVEPSKYTDMQRGITYSYLEEQIAEGDFFPIGKKSLDRVFRLAQECYQRQQKERELLIRQRAENPTEMVSWKSCGLQEWNLRKGDTWYVCKELLTSVDLEIEGCRMNHCVGEYVETCFSGEGSIWSIRKKQSGSDYWTSLVTIQVDETWKYVEECQGYGNAELTIEEQALLKQWTDLNKL